MVCLDRRTWSLETNALDHIWVERPLEKVFNLSFSLMFDSAFDLNSLILEDMDEGIADNLSLLFGVLDVRE